MKLAPIIQALRSRCRSFDGRVFGLAALTRMDETTSPKLPCCYVVPRATEAHSAILSTKFRQEIVESFDVVLAVRLSSDDEPGREGHDAIEDLKAEIFRVLLGAQVEQGVFLEFGGQVVNTAYLNRYRLVETITFSCTDDLDEADTAQGAMIGDLDIFDKMVTTVELKEDAPKVNHQLTNIYEGSE